MGLGEIVKEVKRKLTSDYSSKSNKNRISLENLRNLNNKYWALTGEHIIFFTYCRKSNYGILKGKN